MCEKAVNDYQPTLKFVSYWFVARELLEKLDEVFIF